MARSGLRVEREPPMQYPMIVENVQVTRLHKVTMLQILRVDDVPQLAKRTVKCPR